MSDRQIAIEVKDVDKVYKLYEKPSDRIKEALGLEAKSGIPTTRLCLM